MFIPGLRQSVVGGADNFPAVIIPVKNVTASAFVAFGIYQIDLAQTDGDVTSIDLALSSAIAVATAGIACGLLCVVQSAIAAGDIGYAIIQGRTKVGTVGTTDIAKMDGLKAGNTLATVSKATLATDRYHLIALEANTVDTVTTIIQALMLSPYGVF